MTSRADGMSLNRDDFGGVSVTVLDDELLGSPLRMGPMVANQNGEAGVVRREKMRSAAEKT